METKNAKESAIATINNVAIVIIDDSEKLVPIRPICEAIGVDFDGQRQRIERDDILNSVACVTHATGKDQKQYEMLCLPFKFTFGWLFSIDTSRVNENAKEGVVKYKLECYEALFRYFTEPATFLKEKQKYIDIYLEEFEKAKTNFKNAKQIMDEKRKAFDQIRHFSIDEWRANGRQYVIPFPEQSEEAE